MAIISGVLIGYFIGAFNPSFFIGKIKGFDIRKKGSGNAGGSNALIVMGKLVGTACMIFDILKAFLAVKLVQHLFPAEPLAAIVCSTAVILGHMFPFYMKFKGGKGLACLGGVLLAYSPIIALIFLGIEIAVVIITDYICFVPISASVAYPIVYGIREADLVGALIIGISTVAILFKHTENIKRIRLGTEMRISYLWKGEAEKERVLKNMEKDD